MGNCWTEGLRKGSSQCLGSELGGGKVTLITTTEKWDEKLSEANDSKKTVVANFSASWSPPCRFIAKPYRKLADKYEMLVFLTVDVDKLPEFSKSWKIKATPTFFFIKNGRAVGAFVGADDKELVKKVEEAAAAGFS